jgi:hypothetical protein
VRKRKKWRLALVLGAALLAMGACASPAPEEDVPAGGGQEEVAAEEDAPAGGEQEEAAPEEDAPASAGGEHEIKVTASGVKYIVHPLEIQGGGPPKDGIPSIDDPRYVTVEEADEWIADNELVLTFEHGGVTRVYPLQIMVWHEIVNDIVAGEPILITY